MPVISVLLTSFFFLFFAIFRTPRSPLRNWGQTCPITRSIERVAKRPSHLYICTFFCDRTEFSQRCFGLAIILVLTEVFRGIEGIAIINKL